jgi:Flp pilus assembly protein TadD
VAPLSLAHPATIAALAIAAGCVVFSVTYRIFDADFWQHLAVGRALWTTRAIPHQQVWSWPTWGTPLVLSSWLFRALLWPFWLAGGLNGLFAWRWLTTLAAFALAWGTARRMGAHGFSPLIVVVLSALVYRQRSQVRPETLAAVLLALTIWLLEARRQMPAGGRAGRDPSWWLVGVAWAWANTHISYILGFVVLGIHLVEAHIVARRGRGHGPGPARLWQVMIACAAISFLNPFGWRALWQPFDYFLHWRESAFFQGIGELRAAGWSGNETNGIFLLFAAWPLLLLWRARRAGPDIAETLSCVFFTAYALPSQRFLGVYALVAAPYLARDLDAWVGTRRWPRWSASPGARAGLTAAACLALCIPEWVRPDSAMRPGIGIDLARYPIAACDFIAAHDIRGRAFNHFNLGGYMLWRFWPDRGRLPFMNIHPEDSPPEIRALYVAVFSDSQRWSDVDGRYRFDFVLLARRQLGDDRLYDHLDADSSWSLVFADDAAVLYLRRDGAMAAAARRLAYRVVPAGRGRLAALRAAWVDDDTLRARARAELERQVASSPFDATALCLQADLALTEGRFADARASLEHALRTAPRTPRAHERLGMVAMWESDPLRATAEFERERRLFGPRAALEIELGFARQSMGDREGAREHYRAALQIEPANVRARALLKALDGTGGS